MSLFILLLNLLRLYNDSFINLIQSNSSQCFQFNLYAVLYYFVCLLYCIKNQLEKGFSIYFNFSIMPVFSTSQPTKPARSDLLSWLQGPQPSVKTNSNIFFQKDPCSPQNKKQVTIYIPAECSIKYETIKSLDFSSLYGSIELTLQIRIFAGEFTQLLDQVVQNGSLLFDNGDVLQLKKQNCSKIIKNTSKGLVKYVLTKQFPCSIQAKLFLSPFQQIQLYTSIEFRPIKFQIPSHPQLSLQLKLNFKDPQNLDNSRIQNNYMSIQQQEQQKNTQRNLNIHKDNNHIHHQNEQIFAQNFKFAKSFQYNFYQPAKEQFQMRYCHPQSQQQDQIQERMFCPLNVRSRHGQSFNQIRLRLLLYKKPIISLLSTLLPMAFLSFINLAIFFQSQQMSNRVSSLASLLIAYGTTVFQVRSSIIPGNKITLMELMLYVQTINCILTLVQSFLIRKDTDYEEKFVWYESVLFLIVFIVSIVTNLVFVFLMGKYFCCDLPRYKSTRIKWPKWFKKFNFQAPKFQGKIIDLDKVQLSIKNFFLHTNGKVNQNIEI